MGCIGSKEEKGEGERKPLLKNRQTVTSLKISPPIDGPSRQSSIVTPTSPSQEARRQGTLKNFTRNSSVSSFAEYDVLKRMKALYDYVPSYDDELGFKQDDIIDITNMDNPNWYFGRLNGKSGLVPSNYLQDDVGFLRQTWMSGHEEFTSPTRTGKEDARQIRIERLIATQEEFVADLDKFIQGFVNPIQSSGAIPQTNLEQIFSNIADLRTRNFTLLTQLKASLNSGEADMIGDNLLKNISIFNAFIPFCTNFPVGIIYLRNFFPKPEVSAILESFSQGKPGVVDKFMSKPLQHLVLFVHILKTILEVTAEYHLDHDKVQKALQQIEYIQSLIKEESHKLIEANRLKQIQDKLKEELQKESAVFLGTNLRHLLREGKVSVLKPSSISVRAFLFTDLILFVQVGSEKPTKYHVFQKIPLHAARFEEVKAASESFPAVRRLLSSAGPPVPEKSNENAFIRIVQGDEVLLEFKGASFFETEGWTKAIEDAKATYEHSPRDEHQFSLLVQGPELQKLRRCFQLKSGDLLLLTRSDTLLYSPRTQEMKKIPYFSKEVLQLSVQESVSSIFVLLPTTTPNTGSVRIVPLNSLIELKTEGNEGQFPETQLTSQFFVGEVGEITLLIAMSAKQMIAFQTDESNQFFKLAEIPYPRNNESFNRIAVFSQFGCFLGLGSKFYLFNESPKLKEAGDLSSKRETIGGFDVGDKVLLAYEDKGVLVNDKGALVEKNPQFQWFSQATGCAKLGDHRIAVFGKHLIEIWDLQSFTFLHAFPFEGRQIGLGQLHCLFKENSNYKLATLNETTTRVNEDF